MAGYGSFLGSGFASIGDKIGENVSNFDKDSRGFLKKNPWALGAAGYGMKAAGLLDNPSIGLQALSEPSKAFGGLAGDAVSGLIGAGRGKDFLGNFLQKKGLFGGIGGASGGTPGWASHIVGNVSPGAGLVGKGSGVAPSFIGGIAGSLFK